MELIRRFTFSKAHLWSKLAQCRHILCNSKPSNTAKLMFTLREVKLSPEPEAASTMAEQTDPCRTLRFSSTTLHTPAHSVWAQLCFQLCLLCSHSFHPEYTEAVCLQGCKIRVKPALQPSKGTTLCLCKATGLLPDELSSPGWRKSSHGPVLPCSYFTVYVLAVHLQMQCRIGP